MYSLHEGSGAAPFGLTAYPGKLARTKLRLISKSTNTTFGLKDHSLSLLRAESDSEKIYAPPLFFSVFKDDSDVAPDSRF